MAPKKVIAVVKIQLDAGGATPAPPVGTALGPHGIQTMEFCKQYNAATESQRGSVIPVEITIYEDRTFTFILKTPPDAGPAAPGSGHRQGREPRRTRDRGPGHRRAGRGDRQGQARRPQHRRPRDGEAPGGRHGAIHGHHGGGVGGTMQQQALQGGGHQGGPRGAALGRRGPRPGEVPRDGQVRRDRRARGAARRRPPQGRPDRPGHPLVARRHRHDRARRGLRCRRGRGRGTRRGRRRGRCRRPRRQDQAGASSTSTSPSRRRTSWARSGRSDGSSARGGSCRTRRPARSPPRSARRCRSSRRGASSTGPTRPGNVHLRVGKVSFERADLARNVHAVVEELQRAEALLREGPLLRVGGRHLDDGSGGPHRPPARPRGRRDAGDRVGTRGPASAETARTPVALALAWRAAS